MPLTTYHAPVAAAGEEGEAVEGYRPVCGLAMAGALFGVASLSAHAHPVFWSVAFVGVVINAAALWRISASQHAPIGRRAATIGLTCSLLFGSTAVAHSLLEPVRVRGEARRFAQQWFAALAQGDIQQAHQMTESHWRRLPADNLAWRYDRDSYWTAKLERYSAGEPARTLQALGEGSRVRFVRNEQVRITVDQRRVEDVYEVAVDQGGKQTTCELALVLRCLPNLVTKQWGWEVKSAKWLDAPPAGWKQLGDKP